MIEDHVQTDHPGEHDERGQTDEPFDFVAEKVVRTADQQLHRIGSRKTVGHIDLHTKHGLHQKDRIVFETKTPGAFEASGAVVEPAVHQTGKL